MRFSFNETFNRKEVYDVADHLVGHINDMAFKFGEPSPLISAVAVHMPWTDQIGEYELIKPVDDIVLLLPWDQVSSFDDDRVSLTGELPRFQVISARGLLLVRQDVIDKQILDDEGNRLQRVDDVILSDEDGSLRLQMLYLGMTWLPTSVQLKKVLQRLTHKAKAEEEVDEIPWELVGDVDRESDVLTLKPLSEL